MGYTASLAITSQGETVPSNVRLGDQAYIYFKDNGRFPTNVVAKNGPAMNANFAKLNKLIDTLGLDATREFLSKDFTVKDLKNMGHDIGGENVGTQVKGSAILGPKIGGGFYQNLNSNFNPVTMDLWFMRAWGRLTGTLVGMAPEALAKQRTRLEAALEAAGQKVPKTVPALMKAAEDIIGAHERDYVTNRAAYDSGAKAKSELTYAAERFQKGQAGINEQPGSGSARTWMRERVLRAKDLLAGEGINVTPADLQAIWWYPEKDLYGKLGGRDSEGINVDYASAISDLARKKGVSDDDLARAVGSVDQRSGSTGEADVSGAIGGVREEGSGVHALPQEAAAAQGVGSKLYSFPGALFDPEAWKQLAPAVRPMWHAARGAMTAVKDVGDSIATGLAPMRSGTVRSQAFAATFANSLRQVMYRFGQIDKEIERAFTPKQRDQMGRALDAQSVFEQQVRDLPAEQQVAARAEFDAGGAGLSSLNPAQRQAVETLDRISQDTWRQMQERGMVEPNARPIPYYFPRQMVQWSEEEGFTRAGGEGGGGRGLDARGQNLTTAGPMKREHLTPEETEAAARAKLGAGAQLLRDIRSLPQRLAFAHRAMAGVDLMSKIEEVGKDAGVDLVVRGDIPGLLQPGDYFTMADHPSFRKWTGSGWQPINVSKEFEGPLKAVLTQRSPTWYRAAQMLKGGIMTSIMYSPFIHLAVELGRSLPVMPGKILTLRALRDGSTLRRNLSYMDQATRDGLAPLGQSWHADPVSIADAATVDSKTGFLSAVRGVRDAIANGAGKIGGQTLHDIVQHPHQTLLWDQVFNLQVGIYNTMRDRYISKGFEPDVAGTMAAHIANRYAGALPPEHLSRSANMTANLLLFSRSFTLGNLGVMKDMLNGAPSHIRARIEQMAGPEVANAAQSALRRKAIAAFTMDIGLFYLANGMLQAGLQVMRQTPEQGLPAAAQQTYQQWLDEAGSAMSQASQNPLDAFGVLPQHWNEPGKQDRVYAGTDSQGRGIYLRLPPGKVGEEFLGWFAKPGVLLMNKASPLVRPILESIFGYDSLGRPIYKPNPQTIGDHVDVAGAIVKHIAAGLGPTSTIQGVNELYQQHIQGKPTQADPFVSAMKVVGPLTGLAQVSQGFPGGPAAGELHALSERQRFDQAQAMPEIRDKIRTGDTAGAVEQMTGLRVPRALQRYYIQQTLHPGPSRSGLRNLSGAPPAVQERVQRQLQQP